MILGTRPEAIKMAMLVKALAEMDNFEVQCVSTQQHVSLLSDTLNAMGLQVDREMPAPDRSDLYRLTASVALELGDVGADSDLIVVQGDTLSAFAGALHGFLWQVPVAHLEAGLRTTTIATPHPEEGLRRAISQFSSLHLAPTAGARRNLEREGVDPSAIVVVGNTSIDAIRSQLERIGSRSAADAPTEEPYCVLTVHRRESWGRPMRDIAQAVRALAMDYPEIAFVCPLHPNPTVRSVFTELDPIPNLKIVEPMPHDDFVALLAGSLAILTDSGGIQEEATVLGVPVVILRDETERPEVLAVGVGTLVGSSQERIHEVTRSVINDRLANRLTLPSDSPFGDGFAGIRSARAIAAFLDKKPLPQDMAAIP